MSPLQYFPPPFHSFRLLYNAVTPFVSHLYLSLVHATFFFLLAGTFPKKDGTAGPN